MKKRKTFLTVALLAGILALGIGYAAITGQALFIEGTASATADEANFKVGFDKNVSPVYDGSISVSPTAVYGQGNDEFAVEPSGSGAYITRITAENFSKTGDKAVVTLPVKNFSKELKADLGTITANKSDSTGESYAGSENYFNVSAVYGKEATDGKIILEPGESTTITVTIELTKTPVNDKSIDVHVEFDANPVEA